MKTTTILDGIRVASPCQAGWDSMSGDDQARFCSLCSKNVYNLSAMTTAEAVAFVSEREGEACVRFYRRADGNTLTSDCPVGAKSGKKARFRMLASLGVLGLAMGSTVLAAVGLGSGSDTPTSSGQGGLLDDWVDWAMIKVGLRKPKVYITMGVPICPNPAQINGPDDSDLTPPDPDDSTPCFNPDSVEQN
jgi:hypothetical protein